MTIPSIPVLITFVLALAMSTFHGGPTDGDEPRQADGSVGDAAAGRTPRLATSRRGRHGEARPDTVVRLPGPSPSARLTVEDALERRRSARRYGRRPLRLEEISRLAWAAQGVTGPAGGRTAPSAGALYPLVLYVVAGKVEELPPGVYRYDPPGHRLVRVAPGDARPELARAALGQAWVGDAPAALVLAARPDRTTGKYGRRGIRYVHIEVGHAAQNVYLQAEALGLGTVMVGAFRDDQVARVLDLPAAEMPLGILPVGPPPGSAR